MNDLHRRKMVQVLQKTSLTSSTAADNQTNTTIIKLSETGTIINNTMVPLVHRSQQTVNKSERHQRQQQSTEISVEDHNRSDRSRNNIRVNITNTDHQLSSHTDGGHQTTESKVADICFVSRKIETKTVTVEVHNGPNPSADGTFIPPPPPPMATMALPKTAIRPTSINNTMSVPTPCDFISLSSAISDELKKRKEVNRSHIWTIHIWADILLNSVWIPLPARNETTDPQSNRTKWC